MANRILIGIATAAVLTAAAIFFSSNHKRAQDFEPATPDRSARSQTAASGPGNLPGSDGQLVKPVRRPVLDMVSKLSQLSAIAQADREMRAQSLAEFHQALMLCENVATRLRYPSDRDRERRARGETDKFLFTAGRFCDGQTTTTEAVMSDLLDLGIGNEVVQAYGLRSIQGDEVISAGVPIAERLLLEATAPAAVSDALEFLIKHEQELPRALSLPLPPSLRDADAKAEADRLAVQMYRCDMRGGCGPGGLHSMSECAYGCGPSNSLMASWANSFSPDALQYAKALSLRLSKSRQTSAAR